MLSSAMVDHVGVAQVDLLLAGGVLMEAVLDRYPERFERADRLVLAEFAGDILRREVEVAALIDRHRWLARYEQFEVEELNVGATSERQSFVVRILHMSAQHLAGWPLERGAVEMVDVARSSGPREPSDRPTAAARNIWDRASPARRLPATQNPSIDEPSKVMPSSSAFSELGG